jgi:hypothetical protein
MQICSVCRAEFDVHPFVNGQRLDLRGRKRCLDCQPHRPLRAPRKKVVRPAKTKICELCGTPFPAKAIVDGRMRSLYRRRFCMTCSSFGTHNTSKSPLRATCPEDLQRQRQRRRNAKTYRSQKRRRARRKAELVESKGGRCTDCGYSTCLWVLEFHHRDPATKEFGVGGFNGSLVRLLMEVDKCDLLCANCHRLRHVGADLRTPVDQRARLSRDKKTRAIALMGSACYSCDRVGPTALFEFHHWDSREKDFGISADGLSRPWENIAAELEKCVMLCANCHREVHAGIRTIRPTLLGLAEDALPYVA